MYKAKKVNNEHNNFGRETHKHTHMFLVSLAPLYFCQCLLFYGGRKWRRRGGGGVYASNKSVSDLIYEHLGQINTMAGYMPERGKTSPSIHYSVAFIWWKQKWPQGFHWKGRLCLQLMFVSLLFVRTFSKSFWCDGFWCHSDWKSSPLWFFFVIQIGNHLPLCYLTVLLFWIWWMSLTLLCIV